MTLSTVDKDGQPSSRIVLLKDIDDGFVFFTNYNSKKSEDIKSNNKASLLFHWKVMERQVRIQGHVEMITENQSIEYFQSRPKGSQLGAWASPQSKVIANRETLDDRMSELRDVYQGRDSLPKPLTGVAIGWCRHTMSFGKVGITDSTIDLYTLT